MCSRARLCLLGLGQVESKCMSGLIEAFCVVRVQYFRMIVEGWENHEKNAGLDGELFFLMLTLKKNRIVKGLK